MEALVLVLTLLISTPGLASSPKPSAQLTIADANKLILLRSLSEQRFTGYLVTAVRVLLGPHSSSLLFTTPATMSERSMQALLHAYADGLQDRTHTPRLNSTDHELIRLFASLESSPGYAEPFRTLMRDWNDNHLSQPALHEVRQRVGSLYLTSALLALIGNFAAQHRSGWEDLISIFSHLQVTQVRQLDGALVKISHIRSILLDEVTDLIMRPFMLLATPEQRVKMQTTLLQARKKVIPKANNSLSNTLFAISTLSFLMALGTNELSPIYNDLLQMALSADVLSQVSIGSWIALALSGGAGVATMPMQSTRAIYTSNPLEQAFDRQLRMCNSMLQDELPKFSKHY